MELLGTLRLNTFRGITSAELELEDARPAAAADTATLTPTATPTAA